GGWLCWQVQVGRYPQSWATLKDQVLDPVAIPIQRPCHAHLHVRRRLRKLSKGCAEGSQARIAKLFPVGAALHWLPGFAPALICSLHLGTDIAPDHLSQFRCLCTFAWPDISLQGTESIRHALLAF